MVLLVVLIEGFLRLGQQLPGSPPSDDTLYLRYDNFKVGRLLAFECGHPFGLRSTEVQPRSAAARGDEMRETFLFLLLWRLGKGLFFPDAVRYLSGFRRLTSSACLARLFSLRSCAVSPPSPVRDLYASFLLTVKLAASAFACSPRARSAAFLAWLVCTARDKPIASLQAR